MGRCISAIVIGSAPVPMHDVRQKRGSGMNLVGQVESVWRYPVKSMRGEELPEIFVGFSGVYGDRLYAFKSSAAPAGFPFLTGRNARAMLLYRPRFRDPEKAARPVNLAEAKALLPLLSPLSADPPDLAVEIETPTGQVLSIDDAELLRELDALAGGAHSLSLLRSDRGMTDCRPISLLSLQTVTQLGDEIGAMIDKRRFRLRSSFALPGHHCHRPARDRNCGCPHSYLSGTGKTIDTVRDYPRILRTTAIAIRMGVDVARPMVDAWHSFKHDFSRLVLESVERATSGLLAVAEKWEIERAGGRRGSAATTAPPPGFDYAEARALVLRGEAPPPPWRPWITALQFSQENLHDLAPLASLTDLRSLDLDRTEVSDVAPLAHLTALRDLSLIGTQVSDVDPLARLTALQYLYLGGTEVSDVAPLYHIRDLRIFDGPREDRG
jgi:hypothetical protein